MNGVNLQGSKDVQGLLVGATGVGAVGSMALLTRKPRGTEGGGDAGRKEKRQEGRERDTGRRTILRGVRCVGHRTAKTIFIKSKSVGRLSRSQVKTYYKIKLQKSRPGGSEKRDRTGTPEIDPHHTPN